MGEGEFSAGATFYRVWRDFGKKSMRGYIRHGLKIDHKLKYFQWKYAKENLSGGIIRKKFIWGIFSEDRIVRGYFIREEFSVVGGNFPWSEAGFIGSQIKLRKVLFFY